MNFLFISCFVFLSACVAQQTVPGNSGLDDWYKGDVVNHLKMMAKEKYGCEKILITDTKVVVEENNSNSAELWVVDQCGILEKYQIQKVLNSVKTTSQISTNTSSTTYSTTTYSSVATRPQLKIKSMSVDQ
tara:strand:- start:431 stop:823 length:393 start_codon:yes stop_codon:yes gene_type:complete